MSNSRKNQKKRGSSTVVYTRIFLINAGPPPWPCAFCDDPVLELGRPIGVIHHLDDDSSNNDPTNLQAAHWACHAKAHFALVRPDKRGVPLTAEHRQKMSDATLGKRRKPAPTDEQVAMVLRLWAETELFKYQIAEEVGLRRDSHVTAILQEHPECIRPVKERVCKKGHPMTPDNVTPSRQCKICHRAKNRAVMRNRYVPRPPKVKGTCKLTGCDLPHRSRGLCTGHYQRLMDFGDATKTPHYKMPFVDRLDAALLRDSETGCLNGPREGFTLAVDGVAIHVRRWLFEQHTQTELTAEIKLVPSCENLTCVEPTHMLAMTHREMCALRFRQGWRAVDVSETDADEPDRRLRFVEAFGEAKSITAWSNDPRCPVSYKALRKRLKEGWAAETAIAVPLYTRTVATDPETIAKRLDGIKRAYVEGRTKHVYFPQLYEPGWIEARLSEGLSYRAIGQAVGCSRSTVSAALRRIRASRSSTCTTTTISPPDFPSPLETA